MGCSATHPPRAIVLALDGIIFGAMDCAAETSRLPGLSSLFGHGVRCGIRSTTPPSPACAWTSFSTAQDPGQHGVFDSQQLRPGTYDLVPAAEGCCRSRTLWHYLNGLGLRVGLYGVLWACPPPALNGWDIRAGDEADAGPLGALLESDPVDVCVLGVRPESWGDVHEALSVRSEETAIIAVAAYGVVPTRVRVNVARVLADAGLLCYRSDAHGAQAVGFEHVDWARTRAFSWGGFAQVRLNLRGREPEGVVAPEEGEGIVAEVRQALLHTEHPETGERLFSEARTPGELYQGPNVGAAADVLGLSVSGVDASIHIAAPEAPLFPGANGRATVPTREGLLLAGGPAFRAGDGEAIARAARSAAGLGEPTIMDVGPTLLHALGLPLPQDIDGRPIRRVFDPGYLAEHPPRYSEARLGCHETTDEPVYSQGEAEQVEKRLRDLGYM